MRCAVAVRLYLLFPVYQVRRGEYANYFFILSAYSC